MAAQPVFLRDADTHTQGKQNLLRIAHCWAFGGHDFFLLVFFLGFRKLNRFWIHLLGLHKNIHMKSPSQTLTYAIFGNNVGASFGWDYSQARLCGESLLE